MVTFVRMLGRPSVQGDAHASEPAAGKTTALLYYLAYRRTWVGRDALLGLFYPESDEERARQNLRGLIARVRAVPWSEGVEIEPDRLRWAVPTDVAAFEAGLEEGRPAYAVEMYRGPLLEGFVLERGEAFHAWLEVERATLERRWREAATELAAGLHRDGRSVEAASLLERVLQTSSLDESALRLQLAVLAGAGRTSAAVAAYEAFAAHLEEELEVAPEPATRELIERVRNGDRVELPDGAAPGGPAQPAVAYPGNVTRPLPRPPSAFVGRDEELDKLAEYLSRPDCRLVTVVGPGGIGKSALALEVGRRLESEGRRVVFAPLEHAPSMDAAVALAGDALGLTFFGGEAPRHQLIEALRGASGVVIFDNVEHLDGMHELITDIVRACAGVRVLATSRRTLSVRAEWVVRLDGLRVDGGSGGHAAQLFEGAARRAHAGFEVGPHTEAVERICRLLGGMPLALELAAGWVPVLDPPEIAIRLEDGLELLRSEASDRPARHRDVRGVLEATWLQLGARERRAMTSLAVFTGGFTGEAARAVARVEDATLLRLAGRALVRREHGGRYGHHPLVWRYARDRASEDLPSWTELRERHAAHYAARMAQVGALADERPEEPRPEEAADLPNMLAAWDWMAENERRDLLAMSLDGLFAVALATQRQSEVSRHVAAAADAIGDESPLHGRVLRTLGVLRNWSVDFDGALAPLRKSLEIAERGSDRREEGMACYDLGLALAYSGAQGDGQRALWERCVALFGEAGDRYYEAKTLANVADWEADPRRRAEMQRTAVGGFRECHGDFGLTLALMNLAHTLRNSHGSYGEAEALLDEAVEIERSGGLPFRLAWWLSERAALRLDRGRIDAAERDVHEAEVVAGRLGPGFGAWEADHALFRRGVVRLVRGDPEAASEALGRVSRLDSGRPDPFGRAQAARCWWALAELRAGRTAAAGRLSREALTSGPPSGLSLAHEWWPDAAVAARVLIELLALSDVAAALGAFAEAWESVARYRLLPAALELCLAAAAVEASRAHASAQRTLLSAAATNPAAAARVRRDAREGLAAAGAPNDLPDAMLDFDAVRRLVTTLGLLDGSSGSTEAL